MIIDGFSNKRGQKHYYYLKPGGVGLVPLINQLQRAHPGGVIDEFLLAQSNGALCPCLEETNTVYKHCT